LAAVSTKVLTEASYNSDIRVVVAVFMKPIKEKGVLARDEFLDIFGESLELTLTMMRRRHILSGAEDEEGGVKGVK